jgi:hypothetical protein
MNTSATTSPVAAKVPLSLRQLMDFKGAGGRMRGGFSSNRVTPSSSSRKKRRRLDTDDNNNGCTLPSISPKPPPSSPLVETTQPPPTLPLVETTKPGDGDPNFPIDLVEELDPIEQENGSDRVAAGYEFDKSYILDYDRSNLDNRHVIIPFDELINFIDSNFVCKGCGKSESTYQRQTRGIATSLNWFCRCRAGGAIKARITNQDANTDRSNEWKETTWTRLLPTAAYELNVRFVLGLQQCGGGESDSAVHAGMLDVAVSPFKKTWYKVEQAIGVVEVEVGKKIVDANIQLEIQKTKERDSGIISDRLHGRSLEHRPPEEYLPLTPLDFIPDPANKKEVDRLICKPCRPIYGERMRANKNKTGISVQGDCRWDQRKGGRAYNSDSGTHLLVGNESLKAVAVECISRRCAKCERNSVHPFYLCSKNYEGSSKGMEAEGALRNVRLLYEEKDVFIVTFVMDDDSSTKSILRHSWKLMVDTGILDMLDWPRTLSGTKKTDNGQLPLLHPIVDFLADKNHRVRTYAKYFFKLSKKKRSETSCTSNDAERMKRNFAYFIHMYRHDTFKAFKKNAQAVLEHHFNNHEFCGEWCPANQWQEDEKKLKALKYRCKVKHEKLYEQMAAIHNTYTDVWNLREIYHEFHSNKCESLNGFITKFLPKHKHYCRTIVNRARTYVAIGIDSVGYAKYYSVLWKLLGLRATIITNEHHRRLDKRTANKARYIQLDETKKRRRQQLNDKLREASELLMKDEKKGKTYGSNMAGPQVEGMTLDGSEVQRKKRKAKANTTCKWCHLGGHATQKSKKCLLSVKPGGKHYKIENIGCERKSPYQGCFLTNLIFARLTSLFFWYCKRSYSLRLKKFWTTQSTQNKSWRRARGPRRQKYRIPFCALSSISAIMNNRGLEMNNNRISNKHNSFPRSKFA